MEKRCIFIYSDTKYYDVTTPRGRFRLDEGAYQDYLQGRLWISWDPKGSTPKSSGQMPAAVPPVHISDEAVRLYEAACIHGAESVFMRYSRSTGLKIPYRERMHDIPIDELSLSVRSMNGLKRAGAHSFGALMDLMELPRGIGNIRNLGAKSEREISQVFFTACYSLLTKNEKLEFWQEVAEEEKN